MSSGAARDVLSEVTLFAGLPTSVLETLSRASRTRQYPNGQILCNEGDPGEVLYVLEQGRLRVSRLMASGQEAVLAVVEAPAALGELALLDGAPRDATITAQGPVSVRLLPRAAFLAVMRAEPAVVEGLLRTLAGWIRDANARQTALLGLDVSGRLARWLLQRAERHGQQGPRGTLVLPERSQGELAAELGTTRSTLNRALSELTLLGLVEAEGDGLVLRNFEGLRDLAR